VVRTVQAVVVMAYIAIGGGIWQATIHTPAPGTVASPLRATPVDLVRLSGWTAAGGVVLAVAFFALALWRLMLAPASTPRILVARRYAVRAAIAVGIASIPFVVQSVAYRTGYTPALGVSSAACLAAVIVLFPRVGALASLLGRRQARYG